MLPYITGSKVELLKARKIVFVLQGIVFYVSNSEVFNEPCGSK